MYLRPYPFSIRVISVSYPCHIHAYPKFRIILDNKQSDHVCIQYMSGAKFWIQHIRMRIRGVSDRILQGTWIRGI